MKIALLFPPQWTATQPYSAIASLNGQLQRAGHQVTVHDLNLELWKHALEPSVLRFSWQRLQTELGTLTGEVKIRLTNRDDSENLAHAAKKLQALEAFQAAWEPHLERLLASTPAALVSLRDPELFYQPQQFTHAMSIVDAGFKLFSIPYYPSRVQWNDFSNPRCPLNLEPIRQFCEDGLANPFRRFYKAWLERILADAPDLVAVSIGSFSQVLPGLTLARMLRETLQVRNPTRRPGQDGRPHLSVGGNFFTRLRQPLLERPEFFHAFCDSLMLGEGEGPIVRLARALDREHPSDLGMSDVPNLLYLDTSGSGVLATEERAPPPMEALAPQSLAGFPMGEYLAPETVLCLAASKGCYYGQCAFCDSHYGLSGDTLEVDRLVEQIRGLRDNFGVRHFEFIDQCIEPTYMRRMCEAFLKADLGVHWFCNGRTEAGFTPELCALMKRAGCTMVMWGVETASPRLLKLMRKGVSPSERLGILRGAADAGLWNFAYIFFGFPTETEQEADTTIDFLCANTDVIHSYGRSIFTLGKHSPLFKERDQFGILSFVEDAQEFSTNLTYQTGSGLQADDLNAISSRCLTRSQAAYGSNPLWMALRCRENLHLYLAHHGAQYVQNFRFGAHSQEAAQPDFVF